MRIWTYLFSIGVMLLVLPVVSAQRNITDDDVNAIAKGMYCPVCENIPLDTCGTAACDDWRYEIRLMLEQGMSEEQIRADFVDRFGDHVVGTPLNPILRALSLVTPWLLAILALAIAGRTFMRWGQKQSLIEKADEMTTSSPPTTDYRAMLEQDIKGDLS